MKPDMVDAFHFREHFPALRQLGKVAYQHKILHRTVQSGKDSRTAYGLKHGIDDTVADTGKSGNALLQISPICRLTRVTSPFAAKSAT